MFIAENVHCLEKFILHFINEYLFFKFYFLLILMLWLFGNNGFWKFWCYRTMQTAVGAFGGEGYRDGIDIPPLMVENAGESHHPAISSLNCPPFVAVELCREHLVCP